MNRLNFEARYVEICIDEARKTFSAGYGKKQMSRLVEIILDQQAEIERLRLGTSTQTIWMTVQPEPEARALEAAPIEYIHLPEPTGTNSTPPFDVETPISTTELGIMESDGADTVTPEVPADPEEKKTRCYKCKDEKPRDDFDLRTIKSSQPVCWDCKGGRRGHVRITAKHKTREPGTPAGPGALQNARNAILRHRATHETISLHVLRGIQIRTGLSDKEMGTVVREVNEELTAERKEPVSTAVWNGNGHAPGDQAWKGFDGDVLHSMLAATKRVASDIAEGQEPNIDYRMGILTTYGLSHQQVDSIIQEALERSLDNPKGRNRVAA